MLFTRRYIYLLTIILLLSKINILRPKTKLAANYSEKKRTLKQCYSTLASIRNIYGQSSYIERMWNVKELRGILNIKP